MLCSESIGIILLLLFLTLFNNIGPAQTIDSLLANAIHLAFPIALKVEFKPAKPEIAATKTSTYLFDASIIASLPEAISML